MIRYIITLTFCLSAVATSFSQEYSYTHYDISEGLAGSTVYCITQDKDGFIWVGTETGVSRFDGTHFQNFTTQDGLPDVEILQIFADSKGRVWMAPFRKSICYYYKGKFYNQSNDSVLQRFHFKDNIQSFAEDLEGNILVAERTRLYMVERNGGSREFDSIRGKPITECYKVSRSLSGHLLIQNSDTAYEFNGQNFDPVMTLPHLKKIYWTPQFIELGPGTIVWRSIRTKENIVSLRTGALRYVDVSFKNFRHIGISLIGDSLVYVNESSGSTEYNISTGATRRFMPGMEVSRVFRDDEGNTWFTTLGHGLYRLNSYEIRNIPLFMQALGPCSVHSIARVRDQLLIGTNRNSIFHLRLPKLTGLQIEPLQWYEKNRVLFIDTIKGGVYIYGSDSQLEKDRDRKLLSPFWRVNVKTAFRKNEHELLVASSSGAFVFDLDKFRFTDTLWRERTTTVFFRKDTTYIGTMNGLYLVVNGHPVAFPGEKVPFLRKRIASIVSSRDGTLWIASYDDAGVVGYRNGHVVASITTRQGLTSNICRTLAIQGDFLWVGTDKGLNRVDLEHPDLPILQYTSHDGLGSDMINTVFTDSLMVYLGTSAGLSLFDESKVDVTAPCRLQWLDILNNGNSRLADTGHLGLSYKMNDVRFEFAGISYRSAGNIRYRYRLLGLDSIWKTTRETFLDYPTLPPGKYRLQIVAVNKYGTTSRMLSLNFDVATPFWRSTWFLAGVFLGVMSLTWLVLFLRIRAIRRRHLEKERLNHRMAEMEHTALQAQMNPHFIFNCLNSIQQYIFDQEVLAANKYLTGFARLIRATLHNSSKAFISLAEEIDYLTTYLSLEKLRFKEKMDYRIEVNPGINKGLFIIPPMLIQPYVENSMRHGLRHKTTGDGYIRVLFSLDRSKLIVTIEDNGIGRKQAAAYKTREHIEYQSRGMSLTADRIRMINLKYDEQIHVEVIDLEDSLGNSAGTRVIMQFPLFHMLSSQEAI